MHSLDIELEQKLNWNIYLHIKDDICKRTSKGPEEAICIIWIGQTECKILLGGVKKSKKYCGIAILSYSLISHSQAEFLMSGTPGTTNSAQKWRTLFHLFFNQWVFYSLNV